MDEFNGLPNDLGDVEVIYFDEVEDEDHEIEAEVPDLSTLTFSKHTKPIFSSAVSKDQTIAVTGGEDDIAFVWNIETAEVLLECTGHKDSVTQVVFNYNDQLIATGDMSGVIQVWSVHEKKLVWCYEGDNMEWLMWHDSTNVLISGSRLGDIYIWQITSGNCKVLPSPNNMPCYGGKVLPNGQQLVAGYGDGHLRLWDMKNETAVWTNNDNDSVENLDINRDGSLVITTPDAHIFKTSNGTKVGKILLENEDEIECVVFYDDLGLIITGALSGLICVWQLGKYVLRHQIRIKYAITVIKKGPNNNVCIGATDGVVYICDVNSGMLQVLTGHYLDILSLSVFFDGLKVLTTSDDCRAKIFNIQSSVAC